MVDTRSTSNNPETHRATSINLETQKSSHEVSMEMIAQQLATMAAEIAALKTQRDKGKSISSGAKQGYRNQWHEEGDEEWNLGWGYRGHSKPPFTKMDFPKFENGDPRGWILKAEKYFRHYQTPDELKVDVASMHLEGEALDLFAELNMERTILYWEELVKALQESFGPVEFQNPHEHSVP